MTMTPERLLLIRLAIILGLGLAAQAHARGLPSDKPDLKEFKKFCHEHRTGKTFEGKAPKVGEVVFAPTSAIHGNQSRFSWKATQRKIRKSLEIEKGIYIDKKEGKWVFPKDEEHDDGRSFYPKKNRIKAIYYRGEFFPKDGHHRSIISTYFGAETTPTLVTDDKSDLSPAEFEKYLRKNKLSYFKNYQGQKMNRVDLCDMEDDINLELARRLFARVDIDFQKGVLKISNIRGSEWVIGAKSDADIQFLEFEVADALRRVGVVWDGEDITKDKLKEYLEILQKAAKRKGSRLKKVFLFDKPRRVADMDLHKDMLAHLKKIGCEEVLTVTTDED